MAAPWQGLPVRLERAPHRGAAFALSNAFKGFIVHFSISPRRNAFKGFIVHFSISPRRRSEDSLERGAPEADPIRAAACPLIECVLDLTADGSKERARAVGEVLEVVERIRAALAPRPTVN